jgi:hypothetical protein
VGVGPEDLPSAVVCGAEVLLDALRSLPPTLDLRGWLWQLQQPTPAASPAATAACNAVQLETCAFPGVCTWRRLLRWAEGIRCGCLYWCGCGKRIPMFGRRAQWNGCASIMTISSARCVFLHAGVCVHSIAMLRAWFSPWQVDWHAPLQHCCQFKWDLRIACATCMELCSLSPRLFIAPAVQARHQQLTRAMQSCRPQGSVQVAVSGVERVAVTVDILAHLLGPDTPVCISTAERNSLKQVDLIMRGMIVYRNRASAHHLDLGTVTLQGLRVWLVSFSRCSASASFPCSVASSAHR